MKTSSLFLATSAALAVGVSSLKLPTNEGGTVSDTTHGTAGLVANTVAGGSGVNKNSLGNGETEINPDILYGLIINDPRTASIRDTIALRNERTGMDPALADCMNHVESLFLTLTQLINEQQFIRSEVNVIIKNLQSFLDTLRREGGFQIIPKIIVDSKAQDAFTQDPASLAYARFNGETFTLNSGGKSLTFAVDFSEQSK